MSKSNQEIWDELGRKYGWARWDEISPQPPSMNRYAEAVREDQRRSCATDASIKAYDLGKRLDGKIYAAVRDSGKEPELKPGMLAVCKVGNGLPFQFVNCKHGPIDVYRPLTKTEIRTYEDLAPE